MSRSAARTKRVAFRFAVDGHLLHFKTEFEDGQAAVVNISTGGCALKKPTIALALHEKVLLQVEIGEGSAPLEISGRVCRHDNGFTIIRFTNLDEAEKQRLVKFFAQKQRSRRIDSQ